MADPSRDHREFDQDEQGPASGVPRWMYLLSGVLVVAALVLMVVLHATGVLGSGSH